MWGHFDWIRKWADYSPDKIAVKEYPGSRKLTYWQLNNIGNRLAALLTRDYGIRKGDRIAILAENCLEYLMLFSALQKTGAILTPVNFRLAAPEINFLLQDAQPKLIIHQQKYSELLKNCPQFQEIPYQASLEKMGKAAYYHRDEISEDISDPEIEENDPVFILYTSGTTGFPKGALYTHKMMFWNSINTAMRLGLTNEDRTINTLPFFHTGGWNVLLTPFLHRGAYVCLLNKFAPETALELFEKEKVTVFMAVPTMLKMLTEASNFNSVDLSTVRFFIVGGEALPLTVIETWHKRGVPIRQGYGLTEYGPNVTSLHQTDAIRKMGSIGKPNFYIESKIVDDKDNPVSPGSIGEFCLKGPTCTPGYWQNQDATNAAIKEGWFYTGDYVKQDGDGFLYVVDRKKNMYISGGENVYPAEIEKFLHTHPLINEVAIIGVPDMQWGEVGKAFVVPVPGAKLTSEDVIGFCKDKLAKFKIPRHVVFLAELPKGDTGKIDHKRLNE